jgi:hypothetical protein
VEHGHGDHLADHLNLPQYPVLLVEHGGSFGWWLWVEYSMVERIN